MELGKPRFEFDTVTSTNDFAKEGIAKGVPEGALYTAKHQTKGRGRRGASWSDEPGESALMSFVLYPTFPLEEAWSLSFASALAVCEAIRSFGAMAAIKWPNDIVLDGRKLAGVLVETARVGVGYGAIVGIGVNVAQKSFAGSEEYAMAPISLGMAMAESAPGANEIVAQVGRYLSLRYADCSGAETRQRMLSVWRELLITGELQRGACVETGRRVKGFLRDVRLADGAALLEEQDGTFTIARPIETPGDSTDGV